MQKINKGNGIGLNLVEGFEVYYILNGLVMDGAISLSLPDRNSNEGPSHLDRPDSDTKATNLVANKVNIVRGTNNRFGTSKLAFKS